MLALDTPAAAVLLTLFSFSAGLWLFTKTNKHPLLHPVLTGAILITAVVYWSPSSYATYLDNNDLVLFFLGPAVVALAVPMRTQLRSLRGIAVPALVIILAGSLIAPLISLGLAWALGADAQVLTGLLPKSVTSAIAMGIGESTGGLVTLVIAITTITGVVGAITGPMIFRLVGLSDDRLQGLVLGINAHGIGTARAFDISARCGALAGIAMAVTGCFSAFLLPIAHQWWFGG